MEVETETEKNSTEVAPEAEGTKKIKKKPKKAEKGWYDSILGYFVSPEKKNKENVDKSAAEAAAEPTTAESAPEKTAEVETAETATENKSEETAEGETAVATIDKAEGTTAEVTTAVEETTEEQLPKEETTGEKPEPAPEAENKVYSSYFAKFSL